MDPRYRSSGSPSPDSVASPTATRWTIRPLCDAPRLLASFLKRVSRAAGIVMFFLTN